jgi:uncharacterized protein YfaS (alpha-2-macroglobulin family)
VYALYPWSPEMARQVPAEDRNELEQALFAATAVFHGHSDQSSSTRSRLRLSHHPEEIHTLHGDTYEEKSDDFVRERRRWHNGLVRGWITFFGIISVLCYTGLWVFAITADISRRIHFTMLVLAPLGLYVVLRSSNVREYDSGELAVSDRIEPRMDSQGAMVLRSRMRAEAVNDVRSIGIIETTIAGSSETLIRDHFPETLLWRPQIITDDEGRASVDLTFADSITAWRLSATAVDAEGRLGGSELPLRVVKPFFVDFNLPVSLTRNDEVSVPVVVHNYTDKPQAVTLTLTDGDWFSRSGGPESPLVVEPGKVAAVHYRLTAKRAGTFVLEVRADGQGVADALKRNIEIVPDGRRIDFPPVNGTLDWPAVVPLTVPDKVIDGSVHAQVKLYPSSFSQLLEGLEGIFRMPSGCFEQTSSSTYPNVLALEYLKRTGQDRPEVTRKAHQFIHVGYQRLLGFEISGGGFSWFGQQPAVRTLTAYGLMEFVDMARVHDVDPMLIERTRAWLLKQRQRDGSWQPDGHGAGADNRLTATAYVAWAVFDNNAAAKEANLTLDYLLRRKPADISDPYTLALVANALLALDSTGTRAGPYLDRLETLKRTDGGRFAWWQRAADERTIFYGAGASADVETTALTALAMLKAKRPGSVAAGLAWLMSKKDAHGTWGSTQATVLSLKALLAGTKIAEGGDKERVIEIRLGDKVLKTIAIPPDQAEVMQQFDVPAQLLVGKQTLTLTETTGTASGYQVTLRYHVENTDPGPASRFFDVNLTYDRTEVNMLDMVAVKARVVNRQPSPAAMVMLTLPVPPGFVPLTDDLESLQRDGKIAKFSVEPRQIVVYLRELRRERPLDVRYRLQAVLPVKALSRGARVYEYYAPEREAISVPIVLTVKESR